MSFMEKDKFTLEYRKKQLENLPKIRKTKPCPQDKPIANKNGTNCSKCDVGFYVDLAQMKCVNGQTVTNIQALKASKVL